MKKFTWILVAMILMAGGAFGKDDKMMKNAETSDVGGDYMHSTSATTAVCDNGTSHKVAESTASISIHQDGSKIVFPHGRDVFGMQTSYTSKCSLNDEGYLHCHRASSHSSKEHGDVEVTTIAFAKHTPDGYKGRTHGTTFSARSGVTCGFAQSFKGERQ